MEPDDYSQLMQALTSREAARIATALDEIWNLLVLGELEACPSLTVDDLSPLADRADSAQTARIAELLLQDAPGPYESRLDALARLSARHIAFGSQYAVALELKVQPDPVRAVTHVLAAIGAQLEQLPLDRARPIGFLIDNLLDGEPAVVAATWAALRSWPAVPLRDAVLAAAEVDLEAGRRSFEGG